MVEFWGSWGVSIKVHGHQGSRGQILGDPGDANGTLSYDLKL